MNHRKTVLHTTLRSLSSIALILGFTSTTARSAIAGTLHNGWNYAIDSFNDSTARRFEGGPTDVGGTIFEIYGLAIKEDLEANTISVAINTNLPRNGATVPYEQGFGHTGWGDLLFETSEGLYGFNFTTANDSGSSSMGVYEVSSTKSVALENDGFSSNDAYRNLVTSNGGNPTMGDLAQSDSPFGNATDSLIASGNKIGGIFDIFDTGASRFGLDFGNFGATGAHTFGFSFDKSLLPTGDFVAYLIEECFNDAVALIGNLSPVPDDGGDDGGNVITPQPVPEPDTFGFSSIALFSILVAARRLKGRSPHE